MRPRQLLLHLAVSARRKGCQQADHEHDRGVDGHKYQPKTKAAEARNEFRTNRQRRQDREENLVLGRHQEKVDLLAACRGTQQLERYEGTCDGVKSKVN